MKKTRSIENQIKNEPNFKEPTTTPFYKEINVICKSRQLIGGFYVVIEMMKVSMLF